MDIHGRESQDGQASKALRASEENYRVLVENLNTGVFRSNLTGQFLQANQSVARMAGYDSPGEFMALHASELYADPADRALLKERLARDGEVQNMEIRSLKKDGTQYWISINAVLQRDPEGRPESILGIVNDITDRKRIELALQENESVFSSLFLNSPALLAISRLRDNRLIRVNQAFLATTGFTSEEVIDRTAIELGLIDPLDRSQVLDKLKANPALGSFEMRLRRKDGVPLTVLGSAEIIQIGGEACLLTNSIDISGRKLAEEALQKAQKLESLGVLAGGIAHDFNNFLGGVFGYVYLASAGVTDPTAAENLAKAMKTIERARGLTQQLLTFAKGGVPVRKTGPLFPFVEETARFALSGSNVFCTFDVSGDLWPCIFDPNQIGQVIDNIVINAQQSMPLGGSIELRARNIILAENEKPVLAAGRYVRISVTDQGAGIPREMLLRIFDPFFTTKSKGHGLGLATSYSIIHRHGGLIEVDSEPGQGSTFHIYLQAVPGIAAEPVNVREPGYRGSGTFLLLDDEEMLRNTVGGMLQSIGFSVIAFGQGREVVESFAAEKAAGRTVAGILLDLTVPGGMGGKETLLEIRKLDKQVPVFVFSGYADDPVLASPNEYGFMASLRKPFLIMELEKMLNEHLPPRPASGSRPG